MTGQRSRHRQVTCVRFQLWFPLILAAKTVARAGSVNCVNCKNWKNQSSHNCQPALERNKRPNHPQSTRGSSRRPRPHQPNFQKPCKSPGNALHCSLQPPFAPAALPELDTLRPMNTVCPSYQCPPTMPTAPPRSLPSLAPSVRCPHYRQSLFSYVSDRLRSSEIV